ncbi:hypothetical protein QBC47DRAFT_415347 [Echria macrotheca]|uniref:Uncharacterized protein n=1 Tax=Echria macrotheca TaxID=438768 RepID=A0AAJ0BAQ0_9PEZI|nr:hypothetical protein QBC47DRAFT_415347 [Echria macrotheca]
MATGTSTQPFERHSIVFSPRQSRYVKMGEELQRCLEEMFPDEHKAGYKFMIKNINERWIFDAPRELTDDDKTDMANRIADLRAEAEAAAKAKAEAEAQAAE